MFDAELIDQPEVLPEFVAACGFAVPRLPATRPTISSRRPWLTRRGAAALSWSQAVIAMRSSWPRTRPRPAAAAGRRDGAHRTGGGARALRRRAPAGARLHRAARRPLRQAAGCQGCRPEGCGEPAAAVRHARGGARSWQAGGAGGCLRLYREIATMDAAAPLPPFPDQTPNWAAGAELARDWELNRLAERLAALAQSAQQPSWEDLSNTPMRSRRNTCWRRRMSWLWHRPATAVPAMGGSAAAAPGPP